LTPAAWILAQASFTMGL